MSVTDDRWWVGDGAYPRLVQDVSPWRRLGQYLGLIYADEGQPRSDVKRRSRYDRRPFVSPRLDEDIDELRSRLAELERRLGS